MKKHMGETSQSQQNQNRQGFEKNRESCPFHTNPEAGPPEDQRVFRAEICCPFEKKDNVIVISISGIHEKQKGRKYEN